MEKEELYRMIDEREGYVSLAFPALMRKVYLWMTLALVITAATAFIVGGSPSLMYTIFGNKAGMWIVLGAQLAIVIGLSSRIDRMSLATGTLMFVLYSVLTGVTLSLVGLVYDGPIITKVFLITSGTFAAMAFIGYTTKADLTSLGKIFYMALLGLIIATVVNMFMGSSMLDLVCSYAGVVVFMGLTAYDSHKIKQMLAMCPDADEGAQKVALLGALSLYLDFINLFLYLLRIFGRKD